MYLFFFFLFYQKYSINSVSGYVSYHQNSSLKPLIFPNWMWQLNVGVSLNTGKLHISFLYGIQIQIQIQNTNNVFIFSSFITNLVEFYSRRFQLIQVPWTLLDSFVVCFLLFFLHSKWAIVILFILIICIYSVDWFSYRI